MGIKERFFVHGFTDLDTAPFSAYDYSRLKFGCDNSAKKFGHELAVNFFNAHAPTLIANKCVVIPSPYNYVKNAATVLTHHFCNKLNELLVSSNGEHLDYSTIHRKVSYTNDYGFLSKEKRKSLIDNDSFFFNREFTEGKVLIFIDDIRITGTHEDKLIEILDRDNLDNDCFFLYIANYYGNSPDVEAQLNFAGMTCMADYVTMLNEPKHHVIVRPLKYVLSQSSSVLRYALSDIPPPVLEEIYHGCLGEGYFKIPHYQANFQLIATAVNERRNRKLPC